MASAGCSFFPCPRQRPRRKRQPRCAAAAPTRVCPSLGGFKTGSRQAPRAAQQARPTVGIRRAGAIASGGTHRKSFDGSQRHRSARSVQRHRSSIAAGWRGAAAAIYTARSRGGRHGAHAGGAARRNEPGARYRSARADLRERLRAVAGARRSSACERAPRRSLRVAFMRLGI